MLHAGKDKTLSDTGKRRSINRSGVDSDNGGSTTLRLRQVVTVVVALLRRWRQQFRWPYNIETTPEVTVSGSATSERNSDGDSDGGLQL